MKILFIYLAILKLLHRDLEELLKTHKIVRFALFDQFAFSEHIESGVILEKYSFVV
ncbi:hypothetical protein MASR2M54_06430 [Aliarcobacter cryaerophilus]